MSSDITIQDVFRQFLPEYSETKNFSPQQLLVSQCIMKCRTLGPEVPDPVNWTL